MPIDEATRNDAYIADVKDRLEKYGDWQKHPTRWDGPNHPNDLDEVMSHVLAIEAENQTLREMVAKLIIEVDSLFADNLFQKAESMLQKARADKEADNLLQEAKRLLLEARYGTPLNFGLPEKLQ